MADFASFTETAAGQQIVYVRPVHADDLPDEIKQQVASEIGLSTIYAIHAPSGEVLALAPNRRQAFAVARQNEFAPVSVH